MARLSVNGLESVEPGAWFDGWSHLFVSIIVQALLVSAPWWRRDASVALVLVGAVLSHLVLNLPMHPATIQWYPHSRGGFGNFLHEWASHMLFGKINRQCVEMVVVICGLSNYVCSRVGRRSVEQPGSLVPSWWDRYNLHSVRSLLSYFISSGEIMPSPPMAQRARENSRPCRLEP